MKIENHLDWSTPIIYIEEKEFNIAIGSSNPTEMEVDCSWDYGYGGRGTETMRIDIDTLLNLLIDYKKEIQRRQIEGNKT